MPKYIPSNNRFLFSNTESKLRHSNAKHYIGTRNELCDQIILSEKLLEANTQSTYGSDV